MRLAESLRCDWVGLVFTGLFLLLGTIYSLVTPVFEASDEIFHYPVVQHIANGRGLPTQEPGVKTLWHQEGSQPPLYYLVSAGLTFWVDTGDLEEVLWRNPHSKIGLSVDNDNKNMVIHTEAEHWPWKGTILAVHLVRLFSVILSAGTVFLVHKVAVEVWPETEFVSWLATGMVAFNPMFLFISGSVNNDNLMVFLSSWQILHVVRLIRDGITRRRVLSLSILFALGTITKVSGATLVPVIGLALLIRGLRNNEWKSVLITGGSITAAWLAVGSWWYIRNLVLYNEFFGTRTHVAIIGGREVSFFEVLSQEWYGFWVAYWAWFGAVNILADDWVYFLFGVITCAAIIGTVAWLLRQILVREWGTLIVPGVLLTQIVIILGAVIRWTMITYGSQGRLIFPAFAALCSLGAYGLLYWLPTKIQRPVAISLTTLLMGIAVISPFLYIAPVYVPGPTVNELPQAARPANAVWGPLELVGVEISESGFTVGDYLPVTTYWRLNDTTDLDYSTSYTLYGSDETQVGKLDSYPGLGTWPTTRMTAGMIVRDDSLVQIKGPLSAPSQIRVQIGVGLIEGDRYLILPPLDTAGIPRDVAIFDAGPAYPAQGKGCQAELPPNVESSSFVDFARIRFRELPEKAEPGTDVKVSAVWDTYANPGIEYTAFIHLVSFTGEVIAQGDEPPLNGDYPSNLWYRPCRFDDTFSVELPSDLPPGNYSILFGLYDPADPALARVPVINSDGSPYPDYAIQVGTIAVSAH